MKKEIFKVEGMKCHHCEAHVEDAIKAVVGVANVKADHENDSVEIEYDETQTSADAFKQAVNEIGRYEFLG